MDNKEDNSYVMADPMSSGAIPKKSLIISRKPLVLGVTGILIVAGLVLAYVTNAKQNSAEISNNQKLIEEPFEEDPAEISNNQNPTLPSLEPIEKNLYFAFDSAEIQPSELSKLETFLSEMKEKKGILIVEGHTDNIGTEEYNQMLSQKRAEQVVKVFQKLGLDDPEVTVRGLGEISPVANNIAEQNRALNRRAVILFTEKK